MNAFCGIVRFDGKPIDRKLFSLCEFESPHWKPDRKDSLFTETTAFSSTQRFVTDESKNERIPLVHAESGVVVVSNSYLTYKKAPFLPDSEVILNAYLKWGEDCAKHLHGDFSFAIWDPRNQKVLLATDRRSSVPCYYAFKKNSYLIFANTMAPFRHLCPELTLNQSVLAHFAIDLFDRPFTCYQEVEGLAPGCQRAFFPKKSSEKKYWDLKDIGRQTSLKKREDFYEAFREIFLRSVQEYSRTSFPLVAHISGGLDSSAVALVAANLLSKERKTLYGFTAIPKELEGPSHRENWVYHELPRVQKALQNFPNVEHFVFRTDIHADPFEELKSLFPLVDRPFRNISNTHWFLGSLKHAQSLESRSLLTGQSGNSSISWTGQSWKSRVRNYINSVPLWLKPERAFDSYYDAFNRDFIKAKEIQQALRRRVVVTNPHLSMLRRPNGFALGWGMRSLSLWFGVEVLDPTADTRVQEFCASIPQWVYYRGKEPLQRRLLVREALAGIVPEEIRLNTDRGEQAADWYQQYNTHVDRWRKELDQSVGSQPPLWDWYNKTAINRIFETHRKIQSGSRDSIRKVDYLLMRCLSLKLFIEYLNQSLKVV